MSIAGTTDVRSLKFYQRVFQRIVISGAISKKFHLPCLCREKFHTLLSTDCRINIDNYYSASYFVDQKGSRVRTLNFSRVPFDTHHSTPSSLLLLSLDSLRQDDPHGLIRDDIVYNRGDNDSTVYENCIVQVLSDRNRRWVG